MVKICHNITACFHPLNAATPPYRNHVQWAQLQDGLILHVYDPGFGS